MGLFFDNKFTRMASGIGAGLMSSSKSEGWAPGMARGLGLAAQNVQEYEDSQFRDQQQRWEGDRQRRLEEQDRLDELQRMRDAKLREYQYGVANDPDASPSARTAAGQAQYMSGPALGNLVSQQAASASNAEAAALARSQRQVDAERNRDARQEDRKEDAERKAAREAATTEGQNDQTYDDYLASMRGDPKAIARLRKQFTFVKDAEGNERYPKELLNFAEYMARQRNAIQGMLNKNIDASAGLGQLPHPPNPSGPVNFQ
jgi:hypothetical protein